MVRNRVVASALAGLMVLALAACGDDRADSQGTGSDTTNSAPGDTAAKDAASPGGEVDLETARDFVRITACEGAPARPIGVSATVEVTNPLDEPMEYYGTINFLDGSGAVLTEGVFNTGTLEPGAGSSEEIPGANVYEAAPNTTCELVEVRSDNPA